MDGLSWNSKDLARPVVFGATNLFTVDALSAPLVAQSAQLALPAPSGASSVAVSLVGALTRHDLWIMAVSSSKNDVGRWSSLPLRGEAPDQPRCLARDTSGNVIDNFGTSTVEVKLGGLDEASCRVALQVGAASTNVLSVGKMIDTGNCRLELDSCGSHMVNKPTQGDGDRHVQEVFFFSGVFFFWTRVVFSRRSFFFLKKKVFV